MADDTKKQVDLINQNNIQFEAINAEIKKAEDHNAFLTLEAESIKKNIDFLNENFETRKKETQDFEENYKLRLADLEKIKKDIEEKKEEMIELERNSTNGIKAEVSRLDSEIVKLEKNKATLIYENEKTGKLIISETDNLNKIKLEVNNFQIRKNELISFIDSKIKNAEKIVEDLDNKKSQLVGYESKIVQARETIENLQIEIHGFEESKDILESVLAETNKKIELAQAEFDKISKKSKILIDRTEYQNNQEVYLKEQFEKIGREYQPYSE
jgi:chromosome segregation ATPase